MIKDNENGIIKLMRNKLVGIHFEFMINIKEKRRMKAQKDYMQAGFKAQDVITLKILDRELAKIMMRKKLNVDEILLEANKNSSNFSNELFDDIILYKDKSIIAMYQVKHRTKSIDIKLINKELNVFGEYKYNETIEYKLIIIGSNINYKEIEKEYNQVEQQGIYPNSKIYKVNQYLLLEVVPFSWFELDDDNLSYLNGNSKMIEGFSDLNLKEEYERYLIHQIELIRINYKEYGHLGNINNFYIKLAQKFKLEKFISKISQDLKINNNNFVKRDKTVENILEVLNEEKHLIIFGYPGVGKSFLSYQVYERLKMEEQKVIRYHFYINGENDSQDRLNKKIIVSNISNELNDKYDINLLKINTNEEKVLEELKEESIFIFDGFDHIERELVENEEEILGLINKFSEHKIIIFSQPNDKMSKLKFKTLNIEGFTEEEANEYLENENIKGMDKKKLINDTDRNPLLLSYLKNNSNNAIHKNLEEYYTYIFNNNDKFVKMSNLIIDSCVPLDFKDIQDIVGYRESILKEEMGKYKNILVEKTFPISSVDFFHESFKKYLIKKNKELYEVSKIQEIKIENNNKIFKLLNAMDDYKSLLLAIYVSQKYNFEINYKFNIYNILDKVPLSLLISLKIDKYLKAIEKYFKGVKDNESLYYLSHFESIINTLGYNFSSYDWKYIYNLIHKEGIEYAFEFFRYYIKIYENNVYNNSIIDNEICMDLFMLIDTFKSDGKDLSFFLERISEKDIEKIKKIQNIKSDEMYKEQREIFSVDILNDYQLFNFISNNNNFSTYDKYEKDANNTTYIDISSLECDEFIKSYLQKGIKPSNEYQKWLIQLWELIDKDSFIEQEWKDLLDKNSLINNVRSLPIYNFNAKVYALRLFSLESSRLEKIKFILYNTRLDRSIKIENLSCEVFKGLRREIYSLIEYSKISLNNEEIKLIFETQYSEKYLEEKSNIENIEYLLSKSNLYSRYKNYDSFNFENFIQDIGNWRDYQLGELYIIGENYIKLEAYDEVYQIIYMLYYSADIMDKSKDVWHYSYQLLLVLLNKDVEVGFLTMYSLFVNTNFEMNAINYSAITQFIYEYYIRKIKTETFTYNINLLNVIKNGDDKFVDYVNDEKIKNHLLNFYSKEDIVSEKQNKIHNIQKNIIDINIDSYNTFEELLEKLTSIDKNYDEEFNQDVIIKLLKLLDDNPEELYLNDKVMELDVRKIKDVLGYNLEELKLSNTNRIELGIMYYLEDLYYGQEILNLEKLYNLDKNLFLKKYFDYVNMKDKKISGKFILKFLKKYDLHFQYDVINLFKNRLTNYQKLEEMKWCEINKDMYILVYLYKEILKGGRGEGTIEELVINLRLVNEVEQYIINENNIDDSYLISYLLCENIFEKNDIKSLYNYKGAFSSGYTYNEEMLVNYGIIDNYIDKIEITKEETGFKLEPQDEGELKEYGLIMGPRGIFINSDNSSVSKYKLYISYEYEKYSFSRHEMRSIKKMIVYIAERYSK